MGKFKIKPHCNHFAQENITFSLINSNIQYKP
jgi:hypothetical protein